MALLASIPLLAQFSGLPSWAQAAAREAATAPEPKDADAWVLLDRTEFAYHGDGEIRIKQYRLVKVFNERGASEATFSTSGLGKNVSRIRKLRGWNLRPDGEVTDLDRDDLVTMDADLFNGGYSTSIISAAKLARVIPGSLVAFESQVSQRLPMGPTSWFTVMGSHPIRQYELEVVKDLGWFVSSSSQSVQLRMTATHLDPWVKQRQVGPTSIRLSDVPAIPSGETSIPAFRNLLPRIDVAILDASLTTAPDMRSWDDLAAWTYKTYKTRVEAIEPIPLDREKRGKTLSGIQAWMRDNLRYKQVYLTPERGWIPESSGETVRKRYGDCKDLTTCFLGMAKAAGMDGWPVLALMGDGIVEPDELPVAVVFNHVITAIALTKSLGLPAEVVTPMGRFLLTDPTDPTTPVGWLNAGHRGGRVLLCGPKGGIWAEIPESAMLPESVLVHLDGDVAADGGFTGVLRIRETANTLGLRIACLREGQKALRDLLTSWLDLPLEAVWDIQETTDPKDIEKPFEVGIKLRTPSLLSRSGEEWTIRAQGFPGAPALIQKQGRPRVLPVQIEDRRDWTWEANLTMASPLVPVLAEQRLETPLRSVTWKARREGKRLLLAFHQVRHPAHWNLEHKEEGVAIQRKDRIAYKLLREDMLSLKQP